MWPLLFLYEIDVQTSAFNLPIYFLNILYFIFIYSRFILCFAFFFLAHRLISASEKLDINQEKIKFRVRKFNLKNKYGSYSLVILSLMALFNLFQLLLTIICTPILPFSPFLDILVSLKLIEFDYNLIIYRLCFFFN